MPSYGAGVLLMKTKLFTVAAVCLATAATAGVVRAQFNLGIMYGAGQGLQQDYVEAHKWVSLAERFAAADAELRDKANAARAFLSSKMTTAQISEAQRLAREWTGK